MPTGAAAAVGFVVMTLGAQQGGLKTCHKRTGAPKKDEAAAAVDKKEGDNEAAAAEESDHSEL